MKKRILVILSLLLIGGLIIQNNGFGLFNTQKAYAIGDLTVLWDSTPLFNYSNIAPGFNVTKNVNVANGASSPRPVAVKGILNSDPGNMKSVMHIEIKEGLTTLYSNTLGQFFIDSATPSGISLTTLAPATNTNYSFKVTFDTSAGNEFQNKNIVFDLKIGISIALPSECDAIDLLPAPIIGTSKAEILTGTPGNDLIIGLEGADKINGNGGNDCILGGTGADSINGNSGNDVIFGEDGADSINGNNGNDLLIGGNGADTLRGENGQDHLMGGEGADTLDGGNDNDLLEGNNAADSMRGGNGNDTLVGGSGIDSANGNAGIDACVAETETQCEL